MHRFYAVTNDIRDDKIFIDKEQVHHMYHVLRLKEGDPVLVIDGEGCEYSCVVSKIQEEYSEVMIQSKITKPRPYPQITIVQAIPKLERMDYIVQKSVEIGASCLMPVFTDRTVVTLDSRGIYNKLSRWKKIVVESTKQCSRADLMQIREPVDFKNVFDRNIMEDAVGLIGYLDAGNTLLRDVLENVRGKKFVIFVGPEGDFTLDEVEFAFSKGCKGVSLGSRVLRTDTATVFMLSSIMCMFGK